MADCNQDAKDGCETNVINSAQSCGRCGKACPGSTQQKAVCIDGECGFCDEESRDCNGRGEDGCEVSIALDPKNCGSCGVACPAVPNGVAGCLMGRCILERCLPGFQDCDGDPANGCETDVRMDLKNCGNCGQQCVSTVAATVACQDGACVVMKCNTGFDSCDVSSPVQACETSLLTDEYNCGRCGTKCPAVLGGQRACINGVCTAKACDPMRWLNCSTAMPDPDGCETDIARDPMNCGGCGRVCAQTNGTSGCVKGACQIFACKPGYGNCDGNDLNGCEQDTTRSVDHCSACNLKCQVNMAQHVSGVSCKTSSCAIVGCTGTFQDCDGQYNNGCEADTDSSLDHCGRCNSPCPKKPNATGTCELGVCKPIKACVTGFMDCDRDPENGCEVDITKNRNNCGACYRSCGVLEVCVNGACKAP